MPNGGYSSVSVNINYREFYRVTGQQKAFYKRNVAYYGQYAYATQKPSFSFSYVQHRMSNGSNYTFSGWKSESAVFPANMSYSGSIINTKNMTYGRNTSVQGVCCYQVSCGGAVVPIQVDTVYLHLG